MLRAEILISPAWNKRDPNPNKDYGIHCCDLCFYLVGSEGEGSVSFQIFTGWYLPGDKHASDLDLYPCGADLSYHSHVPLYEGQDLSRKDCKLTGGDCYSDGTISGAEDLVKEMITSGSDVVWRRMLKFYNEKFKTSYRIEDLDILMLGTKKE
jgi:hypothetical protein